MSNLFQTKASSAPSLHVATNHRCKLEIGVADVNKKHHFLLPRLDQKLIKRSNDANECEGKKVKIKTKCHAKTSRGYDKFFDLFCDKLERRKLDFKMDDIFLLLKNLNAHQCVTNKNLR